MLSRDEIRYCRSENVRLQAMELEVDGTNSAHVDLFNRYVDDYNGRCGNFQYREGELESVQREVDAERARLSIEGAARIAEVSARTPAPLAGEVETADPTVGPDYTGDVTEPDSGTPQFDTQDPSSDLPATAGTMQLTQDERESMELTCGVDRANYGDTAYDICISQQIAALKLVPRGHDLSGLSPQQRQAVEAACATAKNMEGPAAYNLCIEQQLGEPRGAMP